LSIQARQQPFPIGLDADNRNMFSCNFDGLAAAPANWTGAIRKLLEDAGLGVFGTDLFIGPGARLPVAPAPGPFITIIDTGGSTTIITHDNKKYPNLSVQLIVTATSYPAGEARARAACDVLDGVRNTTVAA
jgi:hypothetical protein